MLFEEKSMIRSSSGLILENSSFIVSLYHKEPSRVIISVPHDCLMAESLRGLFMVRTNGVHGRDRHVSVFSSEIVVKAFDRGVRVDAVRFLMPRSFVDANRRKSIDEADLGFTSDEVAFDDPLLEDVYDSYFGELSRLVKRSKDAFGKDNILFIDLHGFSRQPKIAPPEGFDLILGTASRRTVPYGEVDRYFAEYMGQCGYRVFLPQETPVVLGEEDPYSAGHTARWIFSEYGVNALQIEISRVFRERGNSEQGKKLTADIAAFLSRCYR